MLRCDEMTRAWLPAEVPASGYGLRLVATVGLLSGPYRQSERQTHQALEDLYQVETVTAHFPRLRRKRCA
jgi:hypothetical protein